MRSLKQNNIKKEYIYVEGIGGCVRCIYTSRELDSHWVVPNEVNEIGNDALNSNSFAWHGAKVCVCAHRLSSSINGAMSNTVCRGGSHVSPSYLFTDNWPFFFSNALCFLFYILHYRRYTLSDANVYGLWYIKIYSISFLYRYIFYF